MIELSGLDKTEGLAKVIGEVALPGDNLVLTGDLGAGKTTLTKGIARGLGIEQMIKSPTYTIIREYDQGRLPLYHMDIYRVAASGADLGLDEYFEGEGLSVIEWGNLLEEALPEDYLELILEKSDTDLEYRYVKLQAYGEQSEAFKQRIVEKWRQNNE
ncbi:tRNA (adenosine(37)-N6)-threonylcarbamoyltransferase complex ATPase subunit type 1 TsaE [Enterococcus hirae]|uniref:tRNA (adenosine(37)-N6)-threonylcarbamoyltransferase complex ATPase subunit type 1 TsaE n=1 Tax=Enterococcus hirae TaxID=1354 RepID=UPI000F704EED|nr:tRNA (adenosine(37)-N6)-threonylcarbamoyltransferase complex ATPase subunit type 1 TsaE [Enterococcus hirae]MBA5271636.1 tRNA (adenosine(37)-N6)-threonylcarbamoyltransferase complex ATPase subunit type 1 TsaE [Enterococcus hirae]MDU4893345.1 tRNA (adenosine(37)-N6)-threonylcarbamoyltransferase complex ATPase subunit type 1 TsaE [Enterococcus hirae]NVL99190.1 tRNA (adenosine(37)-N6)-threonylcarbamoyltransferase complex ATPase subunit type 1 TsaE [Enterococcus hirae]VEE83173.1 ATPase [Enteroco